MISGNIPSNLANLVGPFLPAGQRPVGQETAENRNSTLKPVEQLAKTADTRVSLQYRQPGEGGDQDERERERQQPDDDGAEETAEAASTPDTPSARLAQRFAGGDAGGSRTGRNFDELA